MSHPYTDAFGYPLSAAAALRRMRSERSTGYYDQNGVWRKRRTRSAKSAPPATTPPQVKD